MTRARLISTLLVAAAAAGCPRAGPGPDAGLGCSGCWDNGACVPATSNRFCGPLCVDCRLAARNTTTSSCVNGACATGQCVDGWFDCDDSAGCEFRCDVGNATGVTRGCGAACDYAACLSGFADCDGNRANGCEASCFSVTNATGVTAACAGGAPVCDYAACVTPWLDCDGNRGNGCEASCAPASATGVTRGCPGGSPACDYTACLPTFLDCDGNRANGCEFAPAACPRLQNVSGVGCGCDYTACSPGFFDCDGIRDNGCESTLSVCPTLLAPVSGGRSIAVDDLGVYWTTPGGVFMRAHAGGAVATLASTSALGLAVYNGEVFFTNWPGDSVFRVSRLGGQPTTVATRQPVAPANLAAGAGGIFWTILNNAPGPTSNFGFVMTAPLAGGPPVTLTSGSEQPFALALDSTAVYWTHLRPPPVVRRSTFSTGNIRDYSDSTGPGTVADVGTSIAVASEQVYWAVPERISRAPVDGGAGEVLVRPTSPPRSIATDGLDLYWVEVEWAGGRGAVRALPLDGGSARPLFFGNFGLSLLPFQPALGGQSVALDATAVYWITNEGVYSLPR